MENNLSEKSFNDSMQSVKNTTLLDLNDDCLTHLCNYLDIFDLMNVAKSCTRLKEIASFQYKKIKDFEWNQFEYLPVNADLNEIISLIGSQITSLTFNGSYERGSVKDYCGSIRNKCTRVKSLKLIGSHNYTHIIGQSFILPWLHAIRLENLSVFWSKIDKAFWEINTLKSLTVSFCSPSQAKLHLILKNNKGIESLILTKLEQVIDPRQLIKLKMLHTLSIEITSHKVSQLGLLITELKQLRKLQITCLWRYNDEGMNLNEFLEKSANIGRLEEFIVNGMFCNEKTFATLSLSKLKSLTLVHPVFDKSMKNVPLKLVKTLDYMDSIEHIRLFLKNILISIEDIMMITKLQQLDELNLRYTQCTMVESNLTAVNIFDRINEVLQKQKNRTTLLELTMSKATTHLFLKSAIPEFLLSRQLKFINPAYGMCDVGDVTFSKI